VVGEITNTKGTKYLTKNSKRLGELCAFFVFFVLEENQGYTDKKTQRTHKESTKVSKKLGVLCVFFVYFVLKLKTIFGVGRGNAKRK
jgi:hypothetical protein